MSDKKLAAKKLALQNMSKNLREDSKKPFGEELKGKKLSKVTVVAPDEKGLVKGLSKAEEILKKKFGKLGLDESEMEEADEESEESEEECPKCKDEGCELCTEEELEETEE